MYLLHVLCRVILVYLAYQERTTTLAELVHQDFRQDTSTCAPYQLYVMLEHVLLVLCRVCLVQQDQLEYQESEDGPECLEMM